MRKMARRSSRGEPPDKFDQVLKLGRCPHCGVAQPYLPMRWEQATTDSEGGTPRIWRAYRCSSCGGIVLAAARYRSDLPPDWHDGQDVIQLFPRSQTVSLDIPERARAFLEQAIETVDSPSASIMVACSAIDAMLKEIGYKRKDGNLFHRIKKAAEEHHITKGMADWAHNVRLDANDQRHADEDAPPPDHEDARRCIDFATALGQFLFVLPAMVQRGLKDSQTNKAEGNSNDNEVAIRNPTDE